MTNDNGRNGIMIRRMGDIEDQIVTLQFSFTY